MIIKKHPILLINILLLSIFIISPIKVFAYDYITPSSPLLTTDTFEYSCDNSAYYLAIFKDDTYFGTYVTCSVTPYSTSASDQGMPADTYTYVVLLTSGWDYSTGVTTLEEAREDLLYVSDFDFTWEAPPEPEPGLDVGPCFLYDESDGSSCAYYLSSTSPMIISTIGNLGFQTIIIFLITLALSLWTWKLFMR